MQFYRLFRICLYSLIVLSACKGLYHLVSQAWYFIEGAYAGDAQYYWTVGRGILNGFTLYADIYDTKPPGIYLLSALSLWLFGDGTFGFWLNALMLLLLPLAFCLTALRMATSLPKTPRLWCVLLAGIFGVLLSLYAAFLAEGWQVEWYGAFFGSLYAIALVFFHQHRSRWMTVFLSLCMILAIGFKEPFVLSLLAVALILLPQKNDLIAKFVIPVSITAVVGVVALFLLGYLDGYLSVYLPSQFGHHLVRSDPLWLRGTHLSLLFVYLCQYSYAFGLFIATLFLSVFYDSRFAHRPALRAVSVLFALYLSLTAGNLRGYPVGNHFVVMVPFYAAVFLLVLRTIVERWQSEKAPASFYLCMTLSTLTLLSIPLTDGIPHYAKTLSAREPIIAKHQEVARQLDALLDACSVDRYFFVEERPYMEYMHHSPLNFFVYTGPESIISHHPILIEKQLHSFSQSLMVIANGDAYEIRPREAEKQLSTMTFRYLANNFTIVPWDCAKGLPVPEGYSVLFRKDRENVKPFPFEMPKQKE